ncbi:Cytochrome c-type biogenesis protein CcmH precursor [Jannaschia seosinensis]|uniref:Cytochrome c-type biogenesis protein n=1 Tax=Jannaschia seosinensis TaxID=313367 RepID=A0A0M7B977_9RHOB|nr:cytochrome c-type biogenesis protein [Jannaschia seosinensis]CUH22061.1 Cytochrome c-type biogenesis protein CcmH precursor [Jannaschia seosinensis]
MRALVFALAVLFATPALAVLPDEVLEDPVLEARARALSAELRCPVCRNESIDASNADLSRELRLLVRERLVAGDTDAEVMSYLVDRYGEYILLDPSRGGTNLLLWGAPLGLLLIGGAVAGVAVTRRQSAPEALSPEEEAQLTDLMEEEEDKRS